MGSKGNLRVKFVVEILAVIVFLGFLPTGQHEALPWKCGPANENANCSGALVGMCCSSSGDCGNKPAFCGKGCQENYGPCTKTIKRCGSEFGDAKCPNNECCNRDGNCGISNYNCGKTCLRKYGKCGENYNCGPEYNGGCSGEFLGQCCSSSGNCGTSDEYCDKGCQAGYGTCNMTVTRCGPEFGNSKCPNNECCNKAGNCGTKEEHCGKNCLLKYGKCGKANDCGPKYNGKCSGDYGGQCCSSSGKCGITDDFCGSSCQIGYGRCDSDSTRPRQIKSEFDGECLQHSSSGIDAKPCDGSMNPNNNLRVQKRGNVFIVERINTHITRFT